MTSILHWHDCCRLVITFFMKSRQNHEEKSLEIKNFFAGSGIKILLVFGIRDHTEFWVKIWDQSLYLVAIPKPSLQVFTFLMFLFSTSGRNLSIALTLSKNN